MDVDDPSADSDEVDAEDSRTDNRGETPSKRGGWPEGTTDYVRIEFYEDKKTFEFQTTMQPGDNFRIVGSGDIMTLMNLENDDIKISALGAGNTMAIVDPDVLKAEQSVDKAQIHEHEKYASDVLTVWRKMYLEVDGMGTVKDNEVTATIVFIDDDGFYTTTDANGNVTTSTRKQQWIKISKNLFANLPEESQSHIEGLVNNYKMGKMTIGSETYNTDGNTANDYLPDSIHIINGTDGSSLGYSYIGSSITLEDDDAYKNGDALLSLPAQGIKPAFEPAYILPVEDEAPNPRKTIPFQLHFKEDTSSYLKSVFDKGFDNKDYHEDPDIWVVYLLNAFQGKLDEDGDGENGIMGQSDGAPFTGLHGYGAAVFQESGREEATAYAAGGNGTGWQMPDVAPHEIGHLFGAAHEDGGIMSYDAVKTMDFKPITLDKIRKRKNP